MCNGFPLRFCLRASFERSRSLAEVDHRLCSSISWPPKHCMVSTDVWYAQFPVLWPSGGPDIDVTVARALSLPLMVSESPVVDTWRRLPAASARRPGGCISTVWYHTTCEVLNSRYSGRSDAPGQDRLRNGRRHAQREIETRKAKRRSVAILQRIAKGARRVHSALVDQPACISTVCYHMTCEVLSTRYSSRQTRPRSIAYINITVAEMRETERGESGQWLILFLGGEVAPAASTLVDQPAVYAPYGAIRRVRCSTAFPLLRDRVAPDHGPVETREV